MVVRFVSNDKINICQPWTNDKVKLKAAFDNLFIEGGQSAVRDAIELTARQLLDEAKTQPEKEYALVLISDGSDRNSYYNDKQLFSLIGGTQIQVFAFGLTNELKDFGNSSEKETAERFLHALAERTGGTVYIPGKKHTADDLKAAVISLINELRSGFFSTMCRMIEITARMRERYASRSQTDRMARNAPSSFEIASYFRSLEK